jgi:hypothetical protein
MELSESFWLSIAGLGATLIGVLCWYTRATILTSRCVDLSCCCLRIRNQPVTEQALTEIISHEQPPPLPRISNRAAAVGGSAR